jgi:murein DD-endopeptidase MepM/ murein hydrolase activator NlpD
MLFPTLSGRPFGYLNVNELALRYIAAHGRSDENPLLDPAVSQQMIAQEHERLGIAFSYGGWLEDRRELWRHSYLEKNKTFLHLGVDCNVAAGTPVAVNAGRVIIVDSDYPENGGWGTRVIIRSNEGIHMIYAHLDPTVKVKIADVLPTNTLIGVVGEAPHNGNWYPHVHLQAIRDDAFVEITRRGLSTLDGYGAAKDRHLLAKQFPDPLQFIRLQYL